eukprot:1147653-Pelagomonas_calceolata.AAC.4
MKWKSKVTVLRMAQPVVESHRESSREALRIAFKALVGKTPESKRECVCVGVRYLVDNSLGEGMTSYWIFWSGPHAFASVHLCDIVGPEQFAETKQGRAVCSQLTAT